MWVIKVACEPNNPFVYKKTFKSSLARSCSFAWGCFFIVVLTVPSASAHTRTILNIIVIGAGCLFLQISSKCLTLHIRLPLSKKLYKHKGFPLKGNFSVLIVKWACRVCCSTCLNPQALDLSGPWVSLIVWSDVRVWSPLLGQAVTAFFGTSIRFKPFISPRETPFPYPFELSKIMQLSPAEAGLVATCSNGFIAKNSLIHPPHTMRRV